MDDDLHELAEDLVTTAARMVRWVPKDKGVALSLSAARLLARLQDNGPTRISDLAVAEHCSQPTITNHIKRLEAAHYVSRGADPSDARVCVVRLTKQGYAQLAQMAAAIGTSLQPYLTQVTQQDRQALRDGVDAMRRLMAVERPA